MKLRKDTRATNDAPRREGSNVFRAIGPLLAAPVLLFALQADSEAARHYCTAQVKQGKASAMTSMKMAKGRMKGLTVNLIGAEKGTYVQVSFPDRYTLALSSAAESLPEAQRGTFIADRVFTTLDTARTVLGSKRRAKLLCAPPETDKVALPAMPPRLKGGTGTSADPYLVEVPVPVLQKSQDGTELYSTSKNPSSLKGDGTSIYFAVRFVGQESVKRVTSLADLSDSVAGQLDGKVIGHLRKAGLRNQEIIKLATRRTIGRAAAGMVRSAAKANPAVSEYVPGAKAAEPAPSAEPADAAKATDKAPAEPAKRRRVIRFK